MKKVLLLLAGFALATPAISYAGHYGMAGCGLGSLAFDNPGKWQQVLAATTNGTSGNQTFGITTGTSNCSQDGAMKSDKQTEVFVSMNFDTLHEEMARGSGESLNTFAHLMGCSDTAAVNFGKVAQQKYEGSLGKTSTPEELLNAVQAEVAPVCQVQG